MTPTRRSGGCAPYVSGRTSAIARSPSPPSLSAGTAQGAARALRPVAGPFAGDLFAVGLLASALIALPVIMATTAYATGAHLDWRRGLSLKVREAPLFYTALALSLLLGAVAAYSGVSPIRLLFTAGIAGAAGTPSAWPCS